VAPGPTELVQVPGMSRFSTRTQDIPAPMESAMVAPESKILEEPATSKDVSGDIPKEPVVAVESAILQEPDYPTGGQATHCTLYSQATHSLHEGRR
jgi:hypothetical protein